MVNECEFKPVEKCRSVSFGACFQLRGLEAKVAAFNEVRVQHDHYRIKVDDLKVKVRVSMEMLRCLWV